MTQDYFNKEVVIDINAQQSISSDLESLVDTLENQTVTKLSVFTNDNIRIHEIERPLRLTNIVDSTSQPEDASDPVRITNLFFSYVDQS